MMVMIGMNGRLVNKYTEISTLYVVQSDAEGWRKVEDTEELIEERGVNRWYAKLS